MAPRFSKSGKRLGRPPKNPTASINVQVSAPPPVAEEEETGPVVIDASSMIECEFVPVPQYLSFSANATDKKMGLYSNCLYSGIEGINWNRWVVRAYIKADFDAYRQQGLKNEEIVARCFNFLNATAPRKKYAKKDPVPKYGKLRPINSNIAFTSKFGHESAIVAFTTDDRKNKHFWFEGEKGSL